MRYLFALILFLSPVLHAETEKPVVTHAVLVHGIWERGTLSFAMLRGELESRGVKVLTPDLRPATAHNGLTPLARQLKQEIEDTFGPDQEFLMLGFSMGGLVGRLYLQDMGGAERCQTFITVSSPHHGTEMAHLHPGKGAAEMRPGSVFLSDLEKNAVKLRDIPVISYHTPHDLVIVPFESSIWSLAENVEIHCPLHGLMCQTPSLLEDVLGRFGYPHPPMLKKETRRLGAPHRR